MRLFPPNIPKMKEKRDVKGLAVLLDDEKYFVEAGEALKSMGAFVAEPLLTAMKSAHSLKVRHWVVDLLLSYNHERAFNPLTNVIKSNSQSHIRTKAIELLSGYESPHIEETFKAVRKDYSGSVRVAAVKGLAKIGSESAIASAYELLKDPALWVRDDAVSIIGQIGTLDMIMELLKDPDPELRGWACLVLAQRHPSKALEPLLAVTADSDGDVRAKAVEGIAHIDEKTVKETIVRLASNTQDERVRESALKQIEWHGWNVPAVQVVTPEKPRHLHYGGLGEPYCSDECYKHGTNYALTDIGAGNCGLCGNTLTSSSAGRDYGVIPYEGRILVVCQNCAPSFRIKMKTYSKCCVCQKAL